MLADAMLSGRTLNGVILTRSFDNSRTGKQKLKSFEMAMVDSFRKRSQAEVKVDHS